VISSAARAVPEASRRTDRTNAQKRHEKQIPQIEPTRSLGPDANICLFSFDNSLILRRRLTPPYKLATPWTDYITVTAQLLQKMAASNFFL
jgi:predicted transcriptional regulator